MRSHNNPGRIPRLLGLVDAAARPAEIHALLERSGEPFQSVFADLPEAALGPASLFLVPIADTEAEWVAELDRIDLHTPCLSLVWSRVDLESLVAHLQAFLFADIGENMTAMVRFFDPRCADAVFKVWGDRIIEMFTGPIERWMYRGRHKDWQRIQNDSLTGARIFRSLLIRLDQADIDVLTAHTEPDELMAVLIENDVVDGRRPYLERFADFISRYEQARQWGLADATDRLAFCEHSYRYGAEFDQHHWIRDVLRRCRANGESLRTAFLQVPGVIWQEIEQARNQRTGTAG